MKYNFVAPLTLLVKTKKLMLEKACFHRDYEFLKNKSGVSKNQN